MLKDYKPKGMSETGEIHSGYCYAFLSDLDPQREEKLRDLKQHYFYFFKRATFEEFMCMTEMCGDCDDED